MPFDRNNAVVFRGIVDDDAFEQGVVLPPDRFDWLANEIRVIPVDTTKETSGGRSSPDAIGTPPKDN